MIPRVALTGLLFAIACAPAGRDAPDRLDARSIDGVETFVALYSPEGINARDPGWQAAIAEIQAEASACAPDAATLRQFHNLPLLHLLANAEDRAALTQCAAVDHLADAEPMALHLAQSIPLIRADVAHATFGFDGAGSAVAVLDTGIDWTQAELGGCFGAGCKVAFGYDYADEDDDPSDCFGHGTNVAAIAAGTNGVAPGADILAMKVASDSDCYGLSIGAITSALDELIDLAPDYQTVTVNMSFGSGSYDVACDHPGGAVGPAMKTAFDAGIALVASAGNSGTAGAVAFPACMSDVMSVANSYDGDVGGGSYCLDASCASYCTDGSSTADKLNCSSNGGDLIDIAAPGTYITAGGQTMGGTSQAAPHVAGALAVLGQAVPESTPTERYTWLLRTESTVLDDRSEGFRYPRLDLVDAFNASIDDLQLVSVAVDDDDLDGTSGDGDGLVEAGETVGLDLVLRNGGPGSLGAVSLGLLTEDDWIDLLDGGAAFAGLGPDESASPDDSPNDLLLSVPSDCDSDHDAELLLLAASGEETAQFSFPLGLRCIIDDDEDGWLWTEDCDDLDAAINPDAPELCNAIDDDCDGQTDEDAQDATTFFVDGDGDGYGDAETLACTASADLSVQSGDCDDSRADAYPGAPELCDGLDQSCDGEADEGGVCADSATPEPEDCGCGHAQANDAWLWSLLMLAFSRRARR